MFARLSYTVLLCLMTIGWSFDGGWDAGQIPATAIFLNVDGFSGNLDSDDKTVQDLADKFDTFSGYSDADAQSATGWTSDGSTKTTTALNVGIGTVSPADKLEIIGGFSSGLNPPRTSTWGSSITDYQLRTGYDANTLTGMFLTNLNTGTSARVGIGAYTYTDGTYAKGVDLVMYGVNNTTHSWSADTAAVLAQRLNTGGLAFATNGASPLRFVTNDIVRGIIDANGNYGIGTTTPTSRLTVSGGGSFTGSLSVSGDSTSAHVYGGTVVAQGSSANLISNFQSDTGVDSYTQLALNGEGVNGGTVFTDSSLNAHTITGSGNVATSTAASKYGTSSILFDGTTDYLSGATQQWLNPAGDWTIEFWYNPTSMTAYDTFCGQFVDGNNLWKFDAGASGTHPRFTASWAGTIRLDTHTTNAMTFTPGTWYYLTYENYGGVLYFYKNGVSQALTRDVTELTNINNYNANLKIGYDPLNAGRDINGFMNGLRFSTTSRYKGVNFIPRITQYGSSTPLPSKVSLQGNGVDKWIIGNTSTDSLSIGTIFPDSKLNISSSGNVGIGSTSPSKALDVVGASNISGVATFGNNVGIGTTLPTSLLHVHGSYSGGVDNLIPQMKIVNASTSGGYAFIKTMMGSGFGAGYPEIWIQATGSASTAGTVSIRGVSNHDMTFQSNNTERMRLTRGGNVGIGTTTPSTLLDVKGTIKLQGLNADGNVGISTSGTSCTCTNFKYGLCIAGSCT